MEIFKELNYFTEDERWGDPEKVNGLLLILLDTIRYELCHGIVIHNAYNTSGHSETSQHYKGNATDFHVVGMTFVEAIDRIQEILEKYNVQNHVGLGIYTDWNTPGFHLDVRGVKARWGRVGGKYVAFTTAYSDAKKRRL